jgi:hypothetical protein
LTLPRGALASGEGHRAGLKEVVRFHDSLYEVKGGIGSSRFVRFQGFKSKSKNTAKAEDAAG